MNGYLPKLELLNRPFDADMLTNDIVMHRWNNQLYGWTKFNISLTNRDDAKGGSYYIENLHPYDVIKWTLDGVHVYTGVIRRVQETGVIGGNGEVTAGVSVQGECITGFVNIAKQLFFASWRGDIPVKMQESARQLIQLILNPATSVINSPAAWAQKLTRLSTAMSIQYEDGSKFLLSDFMDLTKMFTLRGTKAIITLNWQNDEGAGLDMLKSVAAQPFHEFFAEAIGGKTYLVMRPTPFLMEDDAWEDATGKSATGGWNKLKTFVTGDAAHIIDEVIGWNFNEGPGTSASVYQVYPAFIPGLQGWQVSFNMPPFVDSKLALMFGLVPQLYPSNLMYAGYSEKNDPDFSKLNSYYSDLTKRVYRFNRDAFAFQNGTVMVPGDPTLRVGDKVQIVPRAEGRTYYTVQTVNTWRQLGEGYTTELYLSRGMQEQERLQRDSDAKAYWDGHDVVRKLDVPQIKPRKQPLSLEVPLDPNGLTNWIATWPIIQSP